MEYAQIPQIEPKSTILNIEGRSKQLVHYDSLHLKADGEKSFVDLFPYVLRTLI